MLEHLGEVAHAEVTAAGRALDEVLRFAGRLAADALATACEHAYDSAHATGQPENSEDLYDKAEELVVRRARELYGQGSGE
jgi:hypothetical protein